MVNRGTVGVIFLFPSRLQPCNEQWSIWTDWSPAEAQAQPTTTAAEFKAVFTFLYVKILRWNLINLKY